MIPGSYVNVHGPNGQIRDQNRSDNGSSPLDLASSPLAAANRIMAEQSDPGSPR